MNITEEEGKYEYIRLHYDLIHLWIIGSENNQRPRKVTFHCKKLAFWEIKSAIICYFKCCVWLLKITITRTNKNWSVEKTTWNMSSFPCNWKSHKGKLSQCII